MFNSKKSDTALELDVMNEIKWDPSISAEKISVSAQDGIVTLRGNVPHYFEKHNAEQAAQRVKGVSAVADEIEVELMGSYERTDEDIARTALTAFEWSSQVPKSLKISVEKGWVTLKGEVEWEYQRFAAKHAVSLLMGVTGVTNEITLKLKVQAADVKNRIQEALKRTAVNEGKKINVTIDGSEVTLSGSVHSFSEMEDARSAAWNAKGVMSVKDNLTFTAI